VIDGFGRLALGQTFAVTRSYGVSPGSIAGGMVQAASGALALGLPGFAGTGGGSLTLRDARVRFHFEAYELTGGVLGGALSVEEVIAAWSSPDVPESLVRSVLEGQADLAPDAGGYCRDISAALVFEAIPAVFE
jgi:hypothetical protein